MTLHRMAAGPPVRRPPGRPTTRSLTLLLTALLFACLAATASPGQTVAGAPPPASLPAATGVITGSVRDVGGATISGALITLAAGDPATERGATSDSDGHFSFPSVSPGRFTLTASEEGLANAVFTATLHPGEVYDAPALILHIATATTDVEVNLSREDLAQADVKNEVQQRVAGVIPNFFIAYNVNPVPLDGRQKFELGIRSTVDYTSFLAAGVFAGIQQATNSLPGYRQGAEGYGRRYGADLANLSIATMLGSALLPTVLRQDPRYFYKGTGTRRSRALYAMSTAFICRGDNGRWQPNYSNVAANIGAGALSNLYYPKGSRNGVGLTFSNSFITLAAGSAGNLLQEFLLRKLTPNLPITDPADPDKFLPTARKPAAPPVATP